MNKDIIMEAEFFLSSFFWGILLLFLYDGIRIFRRVKHHTWFAVASEDILFWGISGIFVFHMVYERNFGIIRAYAAAGMLFGMWLYFKFVSKWFVKSVSRLIEKAENLLIRFFGKITAPFRFLYSKMDKGLGKISGFLQTHIKKLKGKFEKRLKKSMERYKIKRNKKKNMKLARKKEKKEKKNIQNSDEILDSDLNDKQRTINGEKLERIMRE